MPFISKWYYRLTKYIPRKLPITDDEFKELKAIFVSVYGLEDHPKVWYTVASQLVAGPPTSLYRSYGNIVNAAKKLNIAALAQLQRELAGEELQAKLREKTLEMANAFEEEERNKKNPNDTRDIIPEWSDVPGTAPTLPEGTQDIPAVVQPV